MQPPLSFLSLSLISTKTRASSMAERQVQIHSQRPKIGPSAAQVLAVVALVPLGAALLFLAGLTLVGSLVALAAATPLFLIFSPVLLPAAVVIGLAVFSFLVSGALGLTGLSSLSSFFDFVREARATLPGQLDRAKIRMQEMAGQVGQKTREMSQTVQSMAHEAGRT
ncbi:oleosin H2-like [Malania oleifera]|uniref:oleosin H2-like n=1 Tax=Malania oleifera TaxID=397392 RepID=UPI0025AE28B2|nr:oleosin H2-like [Malania oleifera]